MDGQYDLVSIADIVRTIAGGARNTTAQRCPSRLHLRFTTDTAGFDPARGVPSDSRSVPTSRYRKYVRDPCGLPDFARSEVDAVLADARRGTGMTMQEVSNANRLEGTVHRGVVSARSAAQRDVPRARREGRSHDPGGGSCPGFQAEYVPAAALAKRMQTSSRSLMARLSKAGVVLVGAFRDASCMAGSSGSAGGANRQGLPWDGNTLEVGKHPRVARASEMGRD